MSVTRDEENWLRKQIAFEVMMGTIGFHPDTPEQMLSQVLKLIEEDSTDKPIFRKGGYTGRPNGTWDQILHNQRNFEAPYYYVEPSGNEVRKDLHYE